MSECRSRKTEKSIKLVHIPCVDEEEVEIEWDEDVFEDSVNIENTKYTLPIEREDEVIENNSLGIGDEA